MPVRGKGQGSSSTSESLEPAAERARRRRRSTAVAPERIPWLRYDRFSRSVTERLRVRPVPGQPFWLLEVRNPVHHTRYQVALPEYPAEDAQFCSCVDFARKAIGTCKHVEAARAWVSAQPPDARPAVRASRGAASLWSTIDRYIRRATTEPDALRLRRPGRALYERGRSPRETSGDGRGSGRPTPTGRAA